MKADNTTNWAGPENVGRHDTLNHARSHAGERGTMTRKRSRFLKGPGLPGAIRAFVTGAALLATVLHAQVPTANTFSDDNWINLGFEESLVNGAVVACITDPAGNVYIGGDFTFVGTMPANGIAKWDGSSWSALGEGVSGRVLALAFHDHALYVAGNFRAGGLDVWNVARWQDFRWSPLGSGIDGVVYALTILDNQLYAGGRFRTKDGVNARNIARWDGTRWSPLGSGMDADVFALAAHEGDLYAGGSFTTAGGVGANRVAYWDGGAWAPVGAGISGGRGRVRELTSLGGDLYAGGDFTTAGGAAAANVARWDGSAWSPLGSGTDAFVTALTASGDTLYVGGGFNSAGGGAANRIAAWDGGSWSSMGAGFEGAAVLSITISGSKIYAGGAFTAAGGMPASGIAVFSESAWLPLVPGVRRSPTSPFQVETFAVSGDALYVGGRFTNIEGVAANNIAKWDGNTWSPLGEGVNETVDSLVVSGSEVYAGGRFTRAGSVAAVGIAKWDGSAWSPLGSGMTHPDVGGSNDGQVYALAILGSDLYAGGWFDKVSGVKANGIAKWNGSAWSPVGTGVSGFSVALAVIGSDLYVGGLVRAGGVTVNGIAKWDGSVWSPLGSGVRRRQYDGRVTSLATSGTDLYVGGAFTSAGGIQATNIARWDGSTWSPLGMGVQRTKSDTQVQGLAVSGDDLYAVGAFTTAGGSPANHIARWDGTAWSALGSGIELDGNPAVAAVQAVTIWGDKLFSGGHNLASAGGKPTSGIARAFLNEVPPLEVGDGWANVFFREENGLKPGRAHQIERSTDIKTWETLGFRHAGESGGIDFTDAAAPPEKAFYRAVPLDQ